MKNRGRSKTKGIRESISPEALAVFLESLFLYPLGPNPEPEFEKLASAVLSRSARLGQEPDRCRYFCQKLSQNWEYMSAMRSADFEKLAEIIKRGH